MYRLSKLIPVPMRATYTTGVLRQRSTWWQWRDRIWRHRIAAA